MLCGCSRLISEVGAAKSPATRICASICAHRRMPFAEGIARIRQPENHARHRHFPIQDVGAIVANDFFAMACVKL